MKRKIPLVFFIFVFFSKVTYCQLQPIDVTDQTIKLAGLGGEQTLYFGFETGDQIVFNFHEVDGKELKEVQVAEYPENTKYEDYKISQVQNKIINVGQKGIWVFHFSNSAIAGRVCQIKIQRIPASETTKGFNTDVIWKNYNDTTYTEETERYLVKSDTGVSNFLGQTVAIQGSMGRKNTNTIPLTLPENTIAWSYYIGVNERKSSAFSNATSAFAKNAAKVVTSIPDYGPMVALALYGVSYFEQINSGNDAVDFYIVDNNNANLFASGQQVATAFKWGRQIINSFSRMIAPLSGSYYICLKNHNIMDPIDVTVNMTAVTVKKQWGTRPVRKMSIITKNLPFSAN